MKIALICFLFLSQFIAVADAHDEHIRIHILKEPQAIVLEGEDLRVRLKAGGSKLMETKGKGSLSIRWLPEGFQLNHGVVRAKKIWIESAGSRFRLMGKNLSGNLEITYLPSGGFSIVNDLPLERYLVGLINHEISSSWPMESLKAQAVVARSYAVFRKKQRKYPNYDMESSTLDQVYGGTGREDERSLLAVEETSGKVLTIHDEVIGAFYHSCCGGHTELAQNVWGTPYKGSQAVTCGYCTDAPRFYWNQEMTLREVREKLESNGFALGTLQDVRVLRTTPFGRVLHIGIQGDKQSYKLSGNQLRKILGYQELTSTYFRIARSQMASLGRQDLGEDSVIRFIGGGNGHGVGMCQWGARGMAEKDFSYKEILRFYYPGTQLDRL